MWSRRGAMRAWIGVLLALRAVAHGEEGEGTEPAARSVRDDTPFEEVVVTAQKREQRLRDVPLSVTAFDGEDLRRDGIDDLHELADRAPGLRFTSNPCCTTVFIRGLGTPFATSAFEPAVGLSIDGFSLPRDLFLAAPLFDVERLEILRGPQGTLFGGNTTAGLFNVVTISPTDEAAGQVVVRAGNLGTYRLEGGAGGPLGDLVRFRLSGVVSREPGDVRNTKRDLAEPAAEQRGGRLAIEASPFAGFDLRITGEGTLSRAHFHDQLRSLDEDSLEFLRRYDPKVEDDPFDHQTSTDIEEATGSQTTWRFQTNARYTFPGTGFRIDGIVGAAEVDWSHPLDLDSSPAEIIHFVLPNEVVHDHVTGEVRFSGLVSLPVAGAVDLVAGGFFLEAGFDSRSPLRAGRDFDAWLLSAPGFETATGAPGDGFADLGAALSAAGLDPAGVDTLEGDGARFSLDQTTSTQALFTDVSWHFLPLWTLGLGGRITFERKRGRVRNECFSPGFVCAAFGIEELDLSRERRETDFSPRASLKFAPLDELTLFAARTAGFKGGGFNRFAFTPDAVEVDDERVVSWEIGARGALFRERLAYDAVLFHATMDDLQLQSVSGGMVVVRNAASARSRGLELDLRWRSPWEPLHVSASGALLDARFRRFPDAPAPASSDEASQDLSGRPFPYAPDVHLRVSPGLWLPFASPEGLGLSWPRLALVAGLDVVYRSRQFLDLDLDPATRQPGYTLVHLRLGLSSPDDSWSLGLFLENLTDTDALEFTTDSLAFPGGFTALQEFQRRYAFGLRGAW